MLNKTKLTNQEIADNKKSKSERDTSSAIFTKLWNMPILLSMKDGAKSNSQIQIDTAHGTTVIAGQVLRDKLQFFIDNGIVEKVEPDAPYITLINALTNYGRTLLLVIEVFRKVGETHIDRMKKQNE